ncbi:protein of unknown function [Legionella hackeliae]|uniref:Uncharacterized protein n=1 Tax=Legionella hackeliae TaxID=449 RepID=A0A0A8UT38_LEGHA|nr:protein of unknown function [Legionella hackeliae]
MQIKNNIFKFFPLHESNTILIQGDEQWGNCIYETINCNLEKIKKPFRDFLYRFINSIGYSLIICLSFLELRLIKVAAWPRKPPHAHQNE